ncbi:MAG: response regulator [Thermodesulfobacteriota bacterium]
MKLLLVDDEEKFVSRLAERLALRGFDAAWATTADEALAKVGAEKYDIAVLDVKMPSMSGIDLKNRIAQITPGIKFIFITGHGSEQDYDTVCREAVCCIIKPFKIEALVEIIEQALNT